MLSPRPSSLKDGNQFFYICMILSWMIFSSKIPEKKSAKSCVCSKSQRTYVDFANRLLMLASRMRTFRIKCTNLDEQSFANLWIGSSLTRNIQELDIKVDSGRIPSEIFTCNPLVVLKVEGRAELEVPKFVCLPNLRVMKLNHLIVSGDNDTDWEFSVGYPHLEDLELHKIMIMDVHDIRISISTLQKLSVHIMDDCLVKGQTVLNAPNLSHFEHEVPPWCLGFLYSIISQPPFDKLKFLELRGDYDLDLLELVLQNAPYLERLICNVCERVEDPRHKTRGRVMQQLREVEVRNFGSVGNVDSGLKMVLYFLEHGVLLKKMAIVGPYCCFYEEIFESEAFKKLLLQASCSRAVQISFCSSLNY